MAEEEKIETPSFYLFALTGNNQGLKVKVRPEEERKKLGISIIEFTKGSFKTEDPKVAEYLRTCIKEQPSISRLVQEVSIYEAEARAKAAMRQKQLGGGVSGTLTSADVRAASHDSLEARDKELAGTMADPEKAAEMGEQIRKDDMLLTEKAHGGAVETGSGFIPDTDAPVAEAPENAEAKKVFANLNKG